MKDKLTEENVYEIVEHYVSGLSMAAIAEKFRVTSGAIRKVLHKAGVKSRKTGYRKFSLNEDYFNEIDSQNKAYILGLLFGSSSIDKSNFSCTVKMKHQKLRPLKHIATQLFQEDENDIIQENLTTKNPTYKININSKKLTDRLIELGHNYSKKELRFPKLNDEYYPHFLRGYLEGKGSVYINGNVKLKFNGPPDFLCQIQSYLESKHQVELKISSHEGCNNLSILRKSTAKNILNWLYADAELYDPEKVKIFTQASELTHV